MLLKQHPKCEHHTTTCKVIKKKKETFYKEEKHQEGTKTLLQEIRDWNLDESLSFVRVLSTVRVNIKKNKIIKHIEKKKKESLK